MNIRSLLHILQCKVTAKKRNHQVFSPEIKPPLPDLIPPSLMCYTDFSNPVPTSYQAEKTPFYALSPYFSLSIPLASSYHPLQIVEDAKGNRTFSHRFRQKSPNSPCKNLFTNKRAKDLTAAFCPLSLPLEVSAVRFYMNAGIASSVVFSICFFSTDNADVIVIGTCQQHRRCTEAVYL